ncbi:hypothetical protein Droror1_Dr00003404 [Drosera rotundifolia]
MWLTCSIFNFHSPFSNKNTTLHPHNPGSSSRRNFFVGKPTTTTFKPNRLPITIKTTTTPSYLPKEVPSRKNTKNPLFVAAVTAAPNQSQNHHTIHLSNPLIAQFKFTKSGSTPYLKSKSSFFTFLTTPKTQTPTPHPSSSGSLSLETIRLLVPQIEVLVVFVLGSRQEQRHEEEERRLRRDREGEQRRGGWRGWWWRQKRAAVGFG